MSQNQASSTPAAFSFLGCLTYIIGGICLIIDINLGIAVMMVATGMLSIEQYSRRQGGEPLEWRAKTGILLFILAFAIWSFTSCNGWITVLPLFLTGLWLAGIRPLKHLFLHLKESLTSLNTDRWVNIFGMFLLVTGVFVVIGSFLGLVIGATRQTIHISFDHKPLASNMGLFLTLFIGALLFSLGYGIRKRALWAGTLGLCLTFWGLMSSLNSAFQEAGGNMIHVPRALMQHSFTIILNWCFFFGFYSTFYPFISARAKELAESAEGQLKVAGEALKDTQHKLIRAEDQVAQTIRSLEEEKLKFQAAFETINEGLVIFDAKDTILYANPAYCSLYEINRGEWLGKSWRPIFQRPEIECINFDMLDIAKLDHFPDTGGDRPAGGEIIIRDDKGEVRRRTAFYAKRIFAANGEVLAFMGFSRDVTLEREIDRMKTEFVSNVSHELRTPLTSIRAYSEMLIDDVAEDPETRKEYLQIILDEAERLTNLINDILDLSKMEAGKKTYKFGEHQPAQILKKVMTICASGADKKTLALNLHLPDDEKIVLCDQDLLHQAILNLLNNAIKYTPSPGKIDVTLSYFEDRYKISVADTGPGISQEDQKKLFDKFFRVENSLNREIGGTGLGLTLVKQIARVHQGEVGVESEPGNGATFWLDLPTRLSTAGNSPS